MARLISEMRNLGPRMQSMLGEVDILDEDDLRAVGAVDAWHRLRFRFGGRVNLMALYAMSAALQDKPWRAVSAEEKEDLKKAVAGKA